MSMQSGLTDDRADFGQWTSPSAQPRAPHVHTAVPKPCFWFSSFVCQHCQLSFVPDILLGMFASLLNREGDTLL